jgi:hypothetical protein
MESVYMNLKAIKKASGWTSSMVILSFSLDVSEELVSSYIQRRTACLIDYRGFGLGPGRKKEFSSWEYNL